MGTETSHHVVVTDIRMPFWSMVVFMIKWAVAAIPAFTILAVLGGVSCRAPQWLGQNDWNGAITEALEPPKKGLGAVT